MGAVLVICDTGRMLFTQLLLENLKIAGESLTPLAPPTREQAIEIRCDIPLSKHALCPIAYESVRPDNHWVRTRDWTQRDRQRPRRRR